MNVIKSVPVSVSECLTIILSYDIMYVWIRLYFLPNVNRRHFEQLYLGENILFVNRTSMSISFKGESGMKISFITAAGKGGSE